MFKETIEYLGRKIHSYTICEYIVRLGQESDRVEVMNFIDDQAPDTTFMLEMDGDWRSKDATKTLFLHQIDDEDASIHHKAWSENGLHMALREEFLNE